MKRLLIINPDNAIKSVFSAIEPPIWAGLYADYAREHGYEVRIQDHQVSSYNGYHPEEAWIIAMGNNPSASSTPKMSMVRDLSRQLRAGGVEVKVGGIHSLALPEATKRECQAKILPMINIREHEVAWDLLPMDIYRAHNWHCLGMEDRSHYASIYTAYGCPYSCDFCNIHAMYGGARWLPRIPGNVINELTKLKTLYDIRNLKICDELFTVGLNRVVSLCEQMEDFKFNIWAYGKVGMVNPQMLSKMKGAGINWLAYGFESFSSGVRGNKYDSEELTVKMTQDAGINIMGNFIFGLPGDSEDTMKYTLEKAMRYNFEFVNFYVYMPYPGSELWKDSYSHDWSRYSQFSDNPMAKREVIDFRDKAFNEYFTNPDYLNMIERKFGVLGSQQIRDMLANGKPSDKELQEVN